MRSDALVPRPRLTAQNGDSLPPDRLQCCVNARAEGRPAWASGGCQFPVRTHLPLLADCLPPDRFAIVSQIERSSSASRMTCFLVGTRLPLRRLPIDADDSRKDSTAYSLLRGRPSNGGYNQDFP